MTGKVLSSEATFPIVAIGASAGGLEAFEALFKHMPKDPGMAFVLITHLAPEHVSILPQLIQKSTALKVHVITENIQVCNNQIYVIPPNSLISIKNSFLHLEPLGDHRGTNLPIDSFFKSLADDKGSSGACIVLSGTGTDGTKGIIAASDRIGMIIAQSESSAKFKGMPVSAIETGLVDHVLPVENMPTELIKFASKCGTPLPNMPPKDLTEKEAHPLKAIYSLLMANSGHDFSHYKENTLRRRIERRMQLTKSGSIANYIDLLEKSRLELETLFKELLIGVTHFFRDREVFDALRVRFIPKLLAQKQNGDPIRCWVAGCSTGEEAYSLAIIIDEVVSDLKLQIGMQIFATDLDEDAINFARRGLYPVSIADKISPERLKRYFNQQVDGQYKIKKSLREKVVFATQNVIQDPPFTKLDILTCRNLLIYFGSELQEKIIPHFHYSLLENGLLVLGSSESIGHNNDLYNALDKPHKIYERKTVSRKVPRSYSLLSNRTISQQGNQSMPINKTFINDPSTLQLVETLLKESNMLPCAVIDEEHNIIYVHGRTGKFLEPAQGRMSVNIIDMAKPSLKAALTNALRTSLKNQQENTLKDFHLIDGDETRENDVTADITIRPIFQQEPLRSLMMVIFNEKTKANSKRKSASPKRSSKTISELEHELQLTRNSLQTSIEELETANEELKSSNEELQSTNEELQSTNEEIETSKEELQSLNEESSSVNAELQERIDELSKSNDDIKNLLDSTQIATLFLDIDLCVRRFTPKLTDLIPLSTSDVGRPIQHFANNLLNVDLVKYSNKVLDNLNVIEMRVKDLENNNYVMKLRPYRTLNNVIDGVVVTFDYSLTTS